MKKGGGARRKILLPPKYLNIFKIPRLKYRKTLLLPKRTPKLVVIKDVWEVL